MEHYTDVEIKHYCTYVDEMLLATGGGERWRSFAQFEMMAKPCWMDAAQWAGIEQERIAAIGH